MNKNKILAIIAVLMLGSLALTSSASAAPSGNGAPFEELWAEITALWDAVNPLQGQIDLLNNEVLGINAAIGSIYGYLGDLFDITDDLQDQIDGIEVGESSETEIISNYQDFASEGGLESTTTFTAIPGSEFTITVDEPTTILVMVLVDATAPPQTMSTLSVKIEWHPDWILGWCYARSYSISGQNTLRDLNEIHTAIELEPGTHHIRVSWRHYVRPYPGEWDWTLWKFENTVIIP